MDRRRRPKPLFFLFVLGCGRQTISSPAPRQLPRYPGRNPGHGGVRQPSNDISSLLFFLAFAQDARFSIAKPHRNPCQPNCGGVAKLSPPIERPMMRSAARSGRIGDWKRDVGDVRVSSGWSHGREGEGHVLWLIGSFSWFSFIFLHACWGLRFRCLFFLFRCTLVLAALGSARAREPQRSGISRYPEG